MRGSGLARATGEGSRMKPGFGAKPCCYRASRLRRPVATQNLYNRCPHRLAWLHGIIKIVLTVEVKRLQGVMPL